MHITQTPLMMVIHTNHQNFPGGSHCKNPPAMQETWVQSLIQEDPLDKGLVTHSSILAWRISGTEEHGRLWSMGGKQLDMTEQLTLFIHTNISQLFLEKHDFILQIF